MDAPVSGSGKEGGAVLMRNTEIENEEEEHDQLSYDEDVSEHGWAKEEEMNEVATMGRCIFGYGKKRENGSWRTGIFVQQGIESWFCIWKAHGRYRKTKCEARKVSTSLEDDHLETQLGITRNDIGV